MTVKPCPLCAGPIPTAANPGAYPGALSRVDNATEICSDCGVREAMIDWTLNRALTWDDVAVKVSADD